MSVEVPLEQELVILEYMNVAWRVVAYPGDQDVVASADLAHTLNVTTHGNA
jgi:hypothetical protein